MPQEQLVRGRCAVTRGQYRFREHTLTPAEDEPITHKINCKTCGESSPGSDVPSDGADWATTHLSGNSTHLTYRETITRTLRFEPGEWI